MITPSLTLSGHLPGCGRTDYDAACRAAGLKSSDAGFEQWLNVRRRLSGQPQTVAEALSRAFGALGVSVPEVALSIQGLGATLEETSDSFRAIGAAVGRCVQGAPRAVAGHAILRGRTKVPGDGE